MDAATEIELIVYALIYLIAIPIVVVGLVALVVVNYTRSTKERRREEQDALWKKLLFTADNNLELVRDAAYFADRAKKTVRCGFLWRKKKEVIGDAADLTSVLKYIEAHRDTHDGHAQRRTR